MGIIARQATLNTLLAYVGIGLGFINVVLLYPRILQADQFGLTRLLVSIATIAAQVAQLGGENTIVRYFPYFKDHNRNHRGFLSLVLVFGTIVGLSAVLILAVSHGHLSKVFSNNNDLYARHGLFILPLILSEVFFLLLRSYSRSLRRTVQPTFIREFLLRALQTVLILFQAISPMPFDVFVMIYTGLFLICTLMLALDLWRSGNFKIGWNERWLPRRMWKSMATYSSFTFTASVAGIVLGNVDQLMIGALLDDGLRYVAYYAVAFYFGSVIAIPGRAIHQAALPILAEAWKRDDKKSIASLYGRSAMVQGVISAFLFLLLWTGIEDLFTLLPNDYSGGAQVAIIIGAAYFLTSSIGLSAGIISMSKAYKLDAWSSLALLLLNVILNFVLIMNMGIVGAAWATLISLVSINLYRTWFLYSQFHLWPFDLRTVWLIGLVIVIGYVVPHLPFTENPVMNIGLKATAVSLIFWPVAYFTNMVPEVVAMFQLLRKRL